MSSTPSEISESTRRFRVFFLVDDHAVFRSGVRAELGREHDMEIVGEAGGVVEAVTGIDSTKPDVVLLDVHMPDGGGVAVLGRIDPGSVCLALSVSDAAEDVIAVIRAGARGYVTKTISGRDLADASGGWPGETRCSARGWPGSCWIRSPVGPPRRSLRWILNSIR